MTILSPSVERLLSASISRVRRIYLLRGAAMTLASLLAGALAVMAIDAKFAIFSVSARWWMSAALYALVVATAALSILRPLLRRIDARRMAEILDGRHPEHEECLMTLVELNENRSAGCSERLLQVLEKKASDAASRLSAEKEFTARTIVRRLWILLSVAGLLAVLFAVFPGVAGRLFVRAVAPWVDVGNLYADCITVSPGDIDALAGSLVRIEAAVAGGDVPAIRISRRTGKGWGPEFSEPMKDGVYEFIADIGDAEWRYRVSAGHAVTRHYRVRVFETPRCESFVARVEYPAYTRFAPAVYSNEEATTVQAIEGSHVRFEAKPAGKDVFAKIFVGGVETNEHTAVSNIVTSWSLAVSNAAGFSAPERGGLIRSLPDAPPIVVVESPDSGVLSLAPHAKFPLEITASDDVGIFAPELIYAKAGGETVKWRDISEYAKTGPSLWRGMDSIDLSTLDLEGIASVEFAIVVRDFRPERFGGPHCVTSAPVVVRLENRALSFEMQELAKVVEESKRLLAEAENRVNDAQNAAWNDQGRAIHETGEAKKRLEELEALLDADRRFEPIAGEIRRTLEKLFEPALERLRESRYAAQEKRVQSLRETLPELKEALERLRRLEKPFAERVQELENAERVEDLARKQLSLENAARRLAAENPQDPDRLEAWKRMQEEVARETGELIDRLSDRQVDEAWRQMKKAVDLANRLKESLALENDASRSEVAKKQAMDEMARRDMERKREMLAQALEHERAAEWHLGEAAKSQKANPDHAEDQKRQAMQRLRNAADLLEQANAGRDSVKALEAAAEELDKILGSEKPAEKALEATTRSKHELEKEADAFDKTARESASAERRRDAELRKEAAALDAEEELKRATERLASGENGDEFRELDRMMGIALEADRKALEENLDNAANLPQDLAARLDRMKSESGPDSKAAAGDIEKAAKKIAEKLAQGLKAAAERDQGFKSALEERTRREEEAARSWREELERAEYADGQDAMREKSADDGLKRESADFAGQASQSLEEGR
ncbi:MAG: hypothetical protein ILO34_04765, partial [Kiritimatiellae bacterium]|nr:hypothetical protein [Kiritimatiellia bacterium]